MTESIFVADQGRPTGGERVSNLYEVRSTGGTTSNATGASPPPPSRLRSVLAFAGLGVYLAIVVWATMSPTPLDRGYESAIDSLLGVLHRNGVPVWFGYSKLEFSANILMFLPLGFFVALALPRRSWWTALLIVPAFSAAIEFTQYVMLSERFATVQDVAANTIGGYLGALVAVTIRAAVYARDEKVVARALWERAVDVGPS